MRAHGVTLLAAALVVTLSAGAAISVASKSSPGVDFSRYKSYSPGEVPEVKNPAVKKRLADAVDAQLKDRGYVRKDDGGDLRVVIHGRLTKEYAPVDERSWDYGWGTWASMGDLRGSPDTKSLQGVPIGTVLVDVIDASTKQVVWRGTATSALDSEDSAEKRQDILESAMKKLFKGFPRAKK